MAARDVALIGSGYRLLLTAPGQMSGSALVVASFIAFCIASMGYHPPSAFQLPV